MKTLNTQWTELIQWLTQIRVIENITQEYKNWVKDIFNYEQEAANDKINNLSTQVSNELERIFWMDNEVNSDELKLAKILGKEKEMKKLYNKWFSLAWVMQQLDNFQQAA
jgi:hypothetical protein